MNTLIFLGTFLFLYIMFGRKIAIPWGALVYDNLLEILAIALVLEFFEIYFFYSLYNKGITNVSCFKKLRYHFSKQIRTENKKNRLVRWAKRLGWQGVFLISALPSFGGGVLTATILVIMLKLSRRISYLVILLGGVLCNLFLALGARGILNLIRILF